MQVTAEQTDGHLPGYRELEQEHQIVRPSVEGEIPSWVDGSLLRTGPAKCDLGRQRVSHRFDGAAMRHRFSLTGGDGSLLMLDAETIDERAGARVPHPIPYDLYGEFYIADPRS